VYSAASRRDGERWDRGGGRRAAGAHAAERAAVPACRVERPRRHPDDLHGAGVILRRLHRGRRDAPASEVMHTFV